MRSSSRRRLCDNSEPGSASPTPLSSRLLQKSESVVTDISWTVELCRAIHEGVAIRLVIVVG